MYNTRYVTATKRTLCVLSTHVSTIHQRGAVEVWNRHPALSSEKGWVTLPNIITVASTNLVLTKKERQVLRSCFLESMGRSLVCDELCLMAPDQTVFDRLKQVVA